MSKHTPGPWQWHGTDYLSAGSNDVLKSGDDGKSYGMHSALIEHHYDPQVAEANRRLIAAAPYMLALLTECRDYLSCIPESAAGGDDEAVWLTRMADTLIARVNGEQK